MTTALYVVMGVTALIWAAILLPRTIRSISDGTRFAPLAALWTVAFACFAPVLLSPEFSHHITESATAAGAYSFRVAVVAAAVLGICFIFAGLGGMARPSGIAVAMSCLWGILATSSLLQGQNALTVFLMAALILVVGSIRSDGVEMFRHAQLVFRSVTAASLGLWIVSPSAAIYAGNGATRQIFGVGQLAGITEHPNALGTVAAAALCLEIAFYRFKFWNLFGLGTALVCLVMAQSRGGWVDAVVALMCIWLFQPRSTWSLALRGTAIAIVGVVGAGAVFVQESGVSLNQLLTGRVDIWSTVLPLFANSPVIGGGVGVLSVDARASLGGLVSQHAGQAHNQFIETLVDSGLLGVAALVALAIVGLRAVSRLSPSWRPVSAALLALLFTDGLVESPLRSALGGTCFVVFAAIGIISQAAHSSDINGASDDRVGAVRLGAQPSSKLRQPLRGSAGS